MELRLCLACLLNCSEIMRHWRTHGSILYTKQFSFNPTCYPKTTKVGNVQMGIRVLQTSHGPCWLDISRSKMSVVTSCRRSKMLIFPERSTSVRSMTLQHTTHKTYKLKPTIHPQILHASAAAPIRHLMITESAEVDLSVNISSPSSETAGETSATGKLSNSNLL